MRYAVCLEEKHKSRILAAAGNYDLIVVDADAFTAAEIRKLKAKGAKVLTYLNVGAVETDRSYFSAAKRSGLLLGPYDNWPGEYWVTAQKDEWRQIILGLATTMKSKGVDGFWVDNLDVLYTAEEEYGWSGAQLTALYNNLQKILEGLHAEGYVMINGGDVFVTRAIKAKQTANFDAVNQETVITGIQDYNPPGKFGRQAEDEREYYEEYLQEVRMAGKDICLLEYATDPAIIAECTSFAKAKGYTLCISGNIELGGDLKTPQEGVTMDRVTLYKATSDVLLGFYGTGDERVTKLVKAFGKDGQKAVQAAVNDAVKANTQTFIIAVAVISGHYGKGTDRKKKLGKWESKVQAEVNRIYNLRGKSTADAAKLVIAGKFDKDSVRTLLLKFCDYNPATVQAKVNEILQAGKAAPSAENRVRLYAPRFWDNDQDTYYGDESIFLEYDTAGKISKVVIFDTGMSGSNAIKKVQALGITKITAIVITHDHSDHMGLVKAFTDTFEVEHVYFPDQTGVRKYQKSYAERMDSLQQSCEKKGIPVTYMKRGSSFSCGAITVNCIFQADAAKLPEHDNHLFINNMSAVYIVVVNGLWKVLIGGDLSADGIKQMMAAGVNYTCDVLKFLWHSDRGAITAAFAKALKGLFVGYTQYHHNETNGNGRKSTHNLIRDIGALVVRACEDGEISIDFVGKAMTVATTGGVKKTFTK